MNLAAVSQISEMRDTRKFSGGLVTNRKDVKLPPNLDDLRTIDIAMVPIVCYFPKNFYLVKAFNEKIKTLKSAGIFGHLSSFQTFPAPSNETQVRQKVMTLKMLFGAF